LIILRRLFPLLLTLVMAMSPLTAMAATVTDVSREVICQCGCNSVLDSCTHAECHSRETMLNFIEQSMAQGKTGTEITQMLVRQYGEQVLASPPKRGFNLTAWIAPFAAIFIGAGVIYYALRKWARHGEASLPVSAPAEQEGGKYWQQLENDLQDFTERGFR